MPVTWIKFGVAGKVSVVNGVARRVSSRTSTLLTGFVTVRGMNDSTAPIFGGLYGS